LRANLKSIFHRFHLFEVAFVWELTKETIHLPLSCLQGGSPPPITFHRKELSSNVGELDALKHPWLRSTNPSVVTEYQPLRQRRDTNPQPPNPKPEHKVKALGLAELDIPP